MVSKLIKDDQWVWVVIQNPGGNEQFLGQKDEDKGISFIPTFLEKEEAEQGLTRSMPFCLMTCHSARPKTGLRFFF